MSLRISKLSEETMLDLLLAPGYTLRLFTNDVESGLTAAQIEALTAGSFTEATFAGYAAKTLTGGSWVTTALDDPSTGVYAQQTFTRTSTGTAQTIRGYYVTRTTGGTLAWHDYFTPGPLVVTANGDAIVVTPTFTLDDDKEATVAARGLIVPPQILTSNGSAFTASGTTDFALTNVPVDSSRDYKVKLHAGYQITGTPGRWLVNFHVDGVLVDRFHDIDHITSGPNNGQFSAELLWRPATDTVDIDVRVQEISGASTLNFVAAATTQRSFMVEDAGQRLP